jgi:hypothetical protein
MMHTCQYDRRRKKLGMVVLYLVYVIYVELETAQFFWSCECDGSPSLVSHHARWVGVIGVWDQPLFMVSGTLHGLGSEKADTLSTPPINLGMGFESSLWLSFMA